MVKTVENLAVVKTVEKLGCVENTGKLGCVENSGKTWLVQLVDFFYSNAHLPLNLIAHHCLLAFVDSIV